MWFVGVIKTILTGTFNCDRIFMFKGVFMSEEDIWTRQVLCPKIEGMLDDKHFVKCGQVLLYDVNIKSYKISQDKVEANFYSTECKRGKGGYQTDLLINEKISDDEFVPMLVVESKLGGITSHDIMTYNTKAKAHKNLHKHLMYGVVIAGCKKGGATLQKFLNHSCENFDFVFCFKDLQPSVEEWSEFQDLITQKLTQSKKKYNLLASDKKTNFTYFDRDVRTL